MKLFLLCGKACTFPACALDYLLPSQFLPISGRSMVMGKFCVTVVVVVDGCVLSCPLVLGR